MKGIIENSQYGSKYVYEVSCGDICCGLQIIIPMKLYFFDEKGMIISCSNRFSEELPQFSMSLDVVKKESFDYTAKMPYLYELKHSGLGPGYGLVIPINLVGYAGEKWSIKWDEENKYPQKAVHTLTITGMDITINDEIDIPTVCALNECREHYSALAEDLNTLAENLLSYDISNFRGETDKIIKKIELEYNHYASIKNSLVSYTIEDFFKENPDVREYI